MTGCGRTGYAYDDLGNRTSLTFDNGVVQDYDFDPVSRLESLTNNLVTGSDLTKTFAYNPASQITTETKSSDAYAYPKPNVSETGTSNGLNQLNAYAGKSLSHDTKGNVTGFGSADFDYSSENLMTSAPGNTDLAHDPLLRLYEVSTGFLHKSRFAYDGLDAIAEYDRNDALQRRWVFDPTSGQPLVWYEGTGTAATVRRYLSADERGSIVSVSDSAGSSLAINTYDEYGIPEFGALADQRFGYTGQMWLPSVGVWYYKARVYAPQIGGRFLQPDPVGYWDSPNLYAYVLNDPVNFVDPLGLTANEIIVTGILPIDPNYSFGMGGLFGGMGGLAGGSSEPVSGPDIIVTGKRLPQPPSPPRPPQVTPMPIWADQRGKSTTWSGRIQHRSAGWMV